LSGAKNFTFAENESVTISLNISDPDGDSVVVSRGTAEDNQFFSLVGDEIRSNQTFNFELPEDADTNNIYVQTIILNDGKSSVSERITIEITDIEEAPTCTSPSEFNLDENVGGVIFTFTGQDPDIGDDELAVVENFSSSDSRFQNAFSLNSETGELTLNTPLDAEAYDEPIIFDVSADYRTQELSDKCVTQITLIDLPARVSSGILFNDNYKKVKGLPDLDGDQIGEFWIPDEPDFSGNSPVRGTLIYGRTFLDALGTAGAANLNVSDLGNSDQLQIEVTFDRGSSNAYAASVERISDVDGDGLADLLIAADEPTNNVDDKKRRVWAYILYSKTIAENTTGELNLNTLQADQGLTLTGPGDLTQGTAFYLTANLNSTVGDEIVISLIGAMGSDEEFKSSLYVIDGQALRSANANIDFDLDPYTKIFTEPLNANSDLSLGVIGSIGDLEGDGAEELILSTVGSVSLVSSTNLNAASNGTLENLNPLILDLENSSSKIFAEANIDKDGIPELLLSYGNGFKERRAVLVFGSALSPILSSDSKVRISEPDLNAGDFINISSTGGAGGVEEQIQFKNVGDLDGDDRDEVAFTLTNNPGLFDGALYIIRGSALENLSTSTLNVDEFTAAQGTRITGLRYVFPHLSTNITLTPDIDQDGLADFYINSNRRAVANPPGRGAILKSSDISDALENNQIDVDVNKLLFDETPL